MEEELFIEKASIVNGVSRKVAPLFTKLPRIEFFSGTELPINGVLGNRQALVRYPLHRTGY